MKKILISILFIFSFLISYSNDIDINLSASNLNVNIDESFEMSLSIDSNEKINVDNIKIIGEENIKILGTGKSQSSYYINGKSSYNYKLNYKVMGRKTGKYPIKAEIEIKKRKYQSNELEFDFHKDNNVRKSDKRLYFELNPNKKEIYFGEKICVDYKVITKDYRVDFSESYFENDSNSNFVEKNLEQNIKQNSTYINGEYALEYTLKKVLMTPINTGNISIDSKNLVVSLALSSFQRKTTNLHSEPIEINVNPLPKDGKPDNFSEIVGEFNIDFEVDKTTINYGDAATINIRIYGNTNLDLLDSVIKYIDLRDFRVFETMKKYDEKIVNDQYFAEKSFELIVIPKNSGAVTFPSISINYFDIKDGNYKSKKINKINLNVIPNQDIETNNGYLNDKNQIVIDKVSVNNANLESNYNNNCNYYILKIKKTFIHNLLIVIFLVILIAVALYAIKYKKNTNLNAKILKKIDNISEKEDFFEVLNQIIKEKYNFSIKSYSNQKIIERINDYEIKNKVIDFFEIYNLEEYNNLNLEKLKEILKSIV